VLTLALWLTDPDYAETTPVVDLSFFALGAIIGLGLASQLRRPEQRIAGLHQVGIGILSLGVAGVIGARIEPAVGAVLLLLVVAVLVVLHPARRDIFAPGPGINVPVLALSRSHNAKVAGSNPAPATKSPGQRTADRGFYRLAVVFPRVSTFSSSVSTRAFVGPLTFGFLCGVLRRWRRLRPAFL
jgi:hypothetical protein